MQTCARCASVFPPREAHASRRSAFTLLCPKCYAEEGRAFKPVFSHCDRCGIPFSRDNPAQRSPHLDPDCLLCRDCLRDDEETFAEAQSPRYPDWEC